MPFGIVLGEDGIYLKKLSQDEINKINKITQEKAKSDFEGFKIAMKNGQCWICKEPLISFHEEKPCMHWLLMPEGFRKKHFPLVYQNFGMDRLQAFLRWIANSNEPLRDINDIPEEHGNNKVLAVTIRYQDLDWSFSASPNCVAGREGRHSPHYHFQMRIKERPFIDYSDFHIPLSDFDLWVLDVQQGKVPQVRHVGLYGLGIGSMAERIDPNTLLDTIKVADNHKNSTYHVSTLVEAKDGEMISGDDIADLIKESKSTGVPFAKLVQKLKSVDYQVLIEPGPGIVKAAPRKATKRNKKNLK